ncbi:NepR family anti-sigma factor [Hoeflea sp.]|uniref:NepR family anti-sigma factor n=1 Tax=Hoeflea sp. TaxID=1940281 RepID=UPI0025BFFF3E|nr:NepR family anti-sigma factor [Hoeflea sp.]
MMTKTQKGAPVSGKRSSNHDASDAIASQLKHYYKSVEQEPIPDQLLDLLEKLDQAERAGNSNGTN